MGHTPITVLPTPSPSSRKDSEESRNPATHTPAPCCHPPGTRSWPRAQVGLGERDRDLGGPGSGGMSAVPKAPQPPGAPLDVCCTELCPHPLRRGLLGATSDRGTWGSHFASPFLWKLLWRGPGECRDPLHLSPAIWGICHGRERPHGENPGSVPRMHWQGLPWGSMRPQAAARCQPPGPPPGPAHWDPGLGAPEAGSLGRQGAWPSGDSAG